MVLHLAFQNRSVDELLATLSDDKDKRQKYPFEYWERIDFQRYCAMFGIQNRPATSKKYFNWFVIYEHYKRFKLKKRKKFRMILPPELFLEMLRYFYIAKDKHKMKFNVTHTARLGVINVKEAQKANRVHRKKKKSPSVPSSDPDGQQEGN